MNCENPTHQPKATEHIDLMIEMINQLIKKILLIIIITMSILKLKKFSDYGKLSNKKLDDLIAGSRVEVSDNKKIQKILFYGSHLLKMSLPGILHGAKDDQVGT